ncbi:siderophore-interacting protein [Salmonella enterica subsp. enterica serovar Daytona]|uniref:Siderophore-interacting protein n=1 Tax=Salmonella enterica subsp. enterica serovar Daytona TaxID=1962639 RepID=A0A447JC05_SALET|nr:siderophore-interacting protein [Salmonella enterica subsp. enterica serovar Daytona]
MPALRRRLESLSRLPARPAVTALVSIQDAAYRDYLAHLTDITVEYVVDGDEQAMQTRLFAADNTRIRLFHLDYWRRQNGKTFKSVL